MMASGIINQKALKSIHHSDKRTHMLSRFSLALITLLSAALFAFAWALALFYGGAPVPLEHVEWPIVLRELVLCLTLFTLFATAAYMPVRKSIAEKLTIGLGLIFLGSWQEVLNQLILSDWWLAKAFTLTLSPAGLMLATLGLFQLGRAYRLSRLMLGSYQNIERDLATIDQLTQLYNRRYFFSVCGPLIEQAGTEGHRPVLLSLRIMNLTPLNRRLGFQAGDEVLIRVSKAIRRHLRPEHVAARLGGRRFAILLPNASEREAQELANQIRSRVEHVLMTSEEGEEVLTGVDLEARAGEYRPGETLDELLTRIGSNPDPSTTDTASGASGAD